MFGEAQRAGREQHVLEGGYHEVAKAGDAGRRGYGPRAQRGQGPDAAAGESCCGPATESSQPTSVIRRSHIAETALLVLTRARPVVAQTTVAVTPSPSGLSDRC